MTLGSMTDGTLTARSAERFSAGDHASRASMTLGNRTSGGGATSTGQLLLNGHPVDIKLGTLNLGRAENSTANNTGTGVISFDTGTVDITTINLRAEEIVVQGMLRDERSAVPGAASGRESGPRAG